MTTVYSVTPLSGINLMSDTQTQLASDGSTTIPAMGPLGAECFGSDGKRYVFAKAGNTFTASETSCTVNATTFVATSTGGSYIAPPVALTNGQYGWFGVASV
jgi:hypothetical protein